MSHLEADFDFESVCATVHEALRGFVQAETGEKLPSWSQVPKWMRRATQDSVQFVLADPDAPAGEQHRNWMETKLEGGWRRGETKDARRKTHPLLIPYEDLSEFEKQKDRLVIAIVRSFTGTISTQEQIKD